VELLVVMAIIAVLVSLISAAVLQATRQGPIVTCSTEISQLAVAIEAFKRQMGNLTYIPSQLKLSESNKYPNRNTPGSLDNISVTFLAQVFGKRINFAPSGPVIPGKAPPPGLTWLDWNNNGIVDDDIILYGDQVLVFCLGGIPSTAGGNNTTLGFATDPTNPTPGGSNWASSTKTIPFYEFKSGRLIMPMLVGTTPTPYNGFFYYADPFNTNSPFVYLSSYPGGNNYNSSDSPTYLTGTTVTPTIPVAPGPYQDPSGRYINPNTFQILSAGADGIFGPGGSWDPTMGTQTGNGRDDQSNFSRAILGAPQS
jgi:general secretion pathway protein G